jgi:putative membrane protein
VLIFVSLAERYAEIVADTQIDARVPENYWQATVDALTADIGAGRLVEGLVAAVTASGEQLAAHFPRRAGDRNELADKVVEI